MKEDSTSEQEYTKLANFLAKGKWQEADDETLRLMCRVAGREKDGWLDADCIDSFPCKELLAIDSLWMKYSNGIFGFTVQQAIWESTGQDWDLWGETVGWCFAGDWHMNIRYSIDSPVGHLPCKGSWIGGGIPALATRLLACANRQE